MNPCVISFALCVFALVYCDSLLKQKSSINSNPNPTQTAEWIKSQNKGQSSAKTQHVRFPPSKRKRQTIHAVKNTRTKSHDADDLDLDSDANSDYELAAPFPDFEYDINPRIVNGTGVDISDPIPYQLSIRFQKRPPFGEWLHICGGVILDENTAITAAHCFGKSSDVTRYRLTAGENLLNVYEKQEQILQIQKLVIHPEYTDISNGHDIAILHVDKIEFNEHARGVWLSPFPRREIANLTGVISGWGQDSNGGPVSNSLQKGNVSILSPKICHPQLRRLRVAVAGILCALNPDTRVCNGDSGGPLVVPNYKLGNLRGNLLVGIISFGAGKCDIKNRAGYFTEIHYFHDWIQENRAKKPCGENYLPCTSGGCFQPNFKCDKNQDCEDGTDEIGCSGKSTKPAPIRTTTETTIITPKTTTTPKTTVAVVTLSSKHEKQHPITSCSDAMEIFPSPRSKKQRIYPHGKTTSVEVLCDFEVDGGGWTIIQKRTSGPRYEFYRSWPTYADGFGSLDGNFWLGLKNIHALTKHGDQELLIELEDFEGEKKWAKYSSFSISDALDDYRLSVIGFSADSTAGDSLTNTTIYSHHLLDGMKFSTNDNDNDMALDGNCAATPGGGGDGWWYNSCSLSCLNGLYLEEDQSGIGIIWYTWKEWDSLAKTEMKIRTKPLTSITSCSDATEFLPSHLSKKQRIYPHGNGNTTSLEVLCDFDVDGGGWTIIQKRSSGPKLEFSRNWSAYAHGFGSLDGNFWLGLENIHALTKNGDKELRIDLEDFEGNKRFAKYSSFSISDGSDFYRLTIGGFSGDANSTAGDSMANSSTPYGNTHPVILTGMRFSTEDKDNDLYSGGSCAQGFGGGWWYNYCSISHLNAPYLEKLTTDDEWNGIVWYTWKGEPLAKTEMKIRKKNPSRKQTKNPVTLSFV